MAHEKFQPMSIHSFMELKIPKEQEALSLNDRYDLYLERMAPDHEYGEFITVEAFKENALANYHKICQGNVVNGYGGY